VYAHAITPTISTATITPIAPTTGIISTTGLQPTKKVKQYSTSDQELLLQFDDDTVSMKCLQWINNTPSKQLRSTYGKPKIYNNRIDTLLSNRPYTSWTEVFDLPKLV